MHKSIYMSVAALALAGALSTAAAQGGKAKPVQVAQKAKPPAALPMGPVAFPAFAEKTLTNGAQVLVVENHEQPVVSVAILIRGAGTTADADAKPGVAAMTAALLDAGTKTKTSRQIAETVEGMGATIFTSASGDWASLNANMLKSDVDAVLDVVADLLLNAAYPADEVETERKRTLTDLQVALSQPSRLAQRQFEMSVFGKHPYGRQMTTASVRSITRADLAAFHDVYYQPSNALIVVAGDVNPAETGAALEKHLAAWQGAGPARPQYAAAPVRTARGIVLVNKPGAVQASYRIGQTIVPATNPDWPALVVAQQILGGGSKGWLFDQLREKKGFTYGAYAQSTQRLDPGYWYMWGDVRNAVADSAMDVFLSLAQKLKSEPVPAADLELAKAWLAGSFPLTIETPTQIAGQVASARLLGQARDHVQTWRQRLAAVTAADVQRVAQKYLHPENALIVVSGDAAIIKPKLEKFGTIMVVDEEGRPVAAKAAAEPVQGPVIDASLLQPVTLVYGITSQGMEVAEATRSLAHETVAGKDIIKMTETTSGMVSGSSELRFEAKTFVPISSKSAQQFGGREMNSILTVTDGKVSGMVPMPPTGDSPLLTTWPKGDKTKVKC